MISSFFVGLDKVGESLLKITIPHPINNHRPHALQSHGLMVFFFLLLVGQVIANFASNSDKLLGYATSISSVAIISLTNNERQEAGLSSLRENSSLDKAAGFKAQDMFAKDYWAHFAPDGTSPWYFFGLVGYKYTTAGENLARDFATSTGVVDAWMASPGHKANILNSNFADIGVAVVNGNLQGEDTTLVVQLFGKPIYVASSQSGASSSQNQTNGTPAKVAAEVEVQGGNNQEASKEAPRVESTAQPAPLANSSSTKEPLIFSLVKNTSQSQRVTIAMLILISVLFVTDSVIIFRKRHEREGSHSFAHASIIILLAVTSLIYGWGSVL